MIKFRKETAFCEISPEDKKHNIYFEEIAEKILKNVPKKCERYLFTFKLSFTLYFNNFLYL